MAVEEIHILHHTHVDVGYTDLQPVVYAKHVEYIGLALDYCRATDDYPDDARFRWINEFSWPVKRFLEQRPDRAEHGIPYLSVSPNSMVSKPVIVARPFYWVGPGGGRALVWLTDWRKGWYGEGHVLGFPQGFEVARRNVLDYLELLAREGYPWRVLALHLAADNYPPSRDLPDLVRSWNETPGLPRMRISTNCTFFERMLEWHGDRQER